MCRLQQACGQGQMFYLILSKMELSWNLSRGWQFTGDLSETPLPWIYQNNINCVEHESREHNSEGRTCGVGLIEWVHATRASYGSACQIQLILSNFKNRHKIRISAFVAQTPSVIPLSLQSMLWYSKNRSLNGRLSNFLKHGTCMYFSGTPKNHLSVKDIIEKACTEATTYKKAGVVRKTFKHTSGVDFHMTWKIAP